MENIQNYLKEKLNEEQYQAAMCTQASSLILAGAGSGKTRTLTYKIAYLIIGCGVYPSSICAVTFTNKAAREIKERIEEVYGNFHDKQQHEKLSMQRIGTFHSICLKLLKQEGDKTEYGITKDFGVYDEQESLSILKEVLKAKKMDEEMQIKEVKGFISKLKNQGITPEKFKNQVGNGYEETMRILYEEYQRQLQKSNSLDFDDLQLYTFLLLKNNGEVHSHRANKFKHILVDEAQDTNRIQFEILKLLCGNKTHITFIGDDFQSIYKWRGALMENFLNVHRIRPDIQTFKLETNYRSRPHIVSAGKHIIKNNKKQYDKNIKAHRTGDDQITVFVHPDDTSEAVNLLQLIKKMKTDKLKSRSDIGILYRTNAQSSVFEQVLIQEAIPYKIYGGFKFFERKEIKDMLSYLKILLNPRDTVSYKRIINVPKRRIGTESIQKMEEQANQKGISLGELIENHTEHIDLPSITKRQVQELAHIIKESRENAKKNALDKVLTSLLHKIKYKDYLLANHTPEETEEKLQNIGQLINMASKF